MIAVRVKLNAHIGRTVRSCTVHVTSAAGTVREIGATQIQQVTIRDVFLITLVTVMIEL